MARVAVVEDDPEWSELFARLLKEAGHDPVVFATPGRFFDALLKSVPELVVLDMRLPGMHGREVIRVLRANEATRGILIVAVSGEDTSSPDAVKAFEAGADEYLAKPVDQELLAARVVALLRRSRRRERAEEALRSGPLSILLEQRVASLDGADLDLTHLEFELLAYFLRQPNRVLPRSLLLQTVWKTDESSGTRTVDKHVETLRKKLGEFGERIQTVVRVGYVFRP